LNPARERKPQTYWFKDDGLIPNHPRWPLVVYKGAVRLPESLDPAAGCSIAMGGPTRGATASICSLPFAHSRSSRHGVRQRQGAIRLGRTLTVKAGDVAVLPAGTGHQRLKASNDFLVVGAYPPTGTYDECTSFEDRNKALTSIPKTARPRKDPVYGKDGPLLRAWRESNRH
jgi:uncharacterized protein YjlB